MLPDRVSNPGPLTYESGALPIALRGPAVSTIKLKNKNEFLICHRVWKTAKSQGKIREKSGNFELDGKWQPWLHIVTFLVNLINI